MIENNDDGVVSVKQELQSWGLGHVWAEVKLNFRKSYLKKYETENNHQKYQF